ncbi:hypothetical protein N656DRAFT_785404 [Canariomyces notabilis]|uniref:Uncharacterized protein n=1 Tax=Canariomyces notabilis TaxID=2074819 RepID=A0AAN6QBR3_9PEZI|nr:hypothetical protein N656DRAFT_785404 [Canariomyces arenarius]
MPRLSQITYDHAATVLAISDYFDFLAKMYLDEADILRPPEGGWPEITSDRLRSLGKTDKVNMLLRYIPYLRSGIYGSKSEAEVGPSGVQLYNWMESIGNLGRRSGLDAEAHFEVAKVITEPLNEHGEPGLAPPHAVGLTSTSDNIMYDRWILDTELGVIYWVSCPDRMRYEPTREPVLDDWYDFSPEGEREWRCEPAWAVVDFFELLKDQFLQLFSLPVSPTSVRDMGDGKPAEVEGALPLVQAIYREHGWPDLNRYRKDTCLKAVRERLEERYGEECWRLGL